MKIHEFPSSIDLSKCILWQYQNATHLQQLITMLQDATEMASVDLWKKAFGIFDLSRPISATDSDYQYRLYGLHMLTNLFGLKRPSWTSGGLQSLVSVDTWRRYLKGMIWLMDSDGSCEDINIWLREIFPNRKAYVLDNVNMSITYKFFPAPQAGEEDWELVHIDGFLPHPAGVVAVASLTNTDLLLGLDSQVGTVYSGALFFGQPDASRLWAQAGTEYVRCTYKGVNFSIPRHSFPDEDPTFWDEDQVIPGYVAYIDDLENPTYWLADLPVDGVEYRLTNNGIGTSSAGDMTFTLYDNEETPVVFTRVIE